MPKLKRLLVSADFETAKGKRRCCRNRDHEICKGDKCLVINENMSHRSYCVECAALILEKAEEELAELVSQLDLRLADATE